MSRGTEYCIIRSLVKSVQNTKLTPLNKYQKENIYKLDEEILISLQ